MNRESVGKKVRAFESSFLPDDPPPPAGFNTTAHALLYDFKGHYKNVRFTVDQTIECLKTFLEIVPDVQAYISTIEGKADERSRNLYGIGWDNACELMLVYFSRTLDDNLNELVAYIHISKAIEKVDALLKVVDPDDERIGIDALKRLYSVQRNLKHIVETYG